MRVFIAEKRSVAEALATEMGRPMPGEGFYRVEEDIVTWALGHLLELAPPEKYNKSWKRWRRDDLPLLPEQLQLVPITKHKQHLQQIRMLIRDSHTTEIINACDAGREGELIFAWILQGEKATVYKKYKQRLWLSSLQPNAIQEGLRNLRPAEDFRFLEEAARSRAEADWLLGINATRAATIALKNRGVVSLGRVQTPTLAMLVKREKEIQAFQPETFWTVRALFHSKNGEYTGEHKEGRISKTRAKAIKENISKEAVVEKISKKEVRKEPPLLYDLTSLQRDASSLWGWSAQRTLQVAQDLYEKEKVLSYPRTDSRFLPEDMKKDLDHIKNLLPPLKQRKDLQRIFKDSGVSDHHALIPVASGKHLQGDHKKLFYLVQKRVAAALSPDSIWEACTVTTSCQEEEFISKGKIYQEWGWKDFYRDQENDQLPILSPNEAVRVQKVDASEGQTKPPPRFSDGTLLGVMETSGRKVEDAEAREVMKESGLGTPATRAAIIEKLIRVDYLQRDGKSLQPTEKGIEVITSLEGSKLLLPELTGEWEKSLRQIEEEGKSDIFMSRLRKWVAEETEGLLSLLPAGEIDWGLCPGCSQPLRENKAAISCWQKDNPGCGFALWKKVAGKKLSEKTLRQLLENKQAGPLRGFRSRQGKSFAAEVHLIKQQDGTWKTELIYGSEK